MAFRSQPWRIGTGRAALCLFAVSVIGFGIGLSGPFHQQPKTVLGPQTQINVDTQDLQRVVLQSDRGVATNWGSYGNTTRLVFFGYTFCPDICPMGLSNIAGALDILGDQALDLIPIFVSVDPKRDTPEVLSEYVSVFHDRLQGLTGKPDQIKTLTSAFMAYYQVNAESESDEFYLVDHTSFVYLVDDVGNVLGYYPESEAPEMLAASIRADLGTAAVK